MTISIPLYCVMLIFLVYFLGSNWAPPYHVSINTTCIKSVSCMGSCIRFLVVYVLCTSSLQYDFQHYVKESHYEKFLSYLRKDIFGVFKKQKYKFPDIIFYTKSPICTHFYMLCNVAVFLFYSFIVFLICQDKQFIISVDWISNKRRPRCQSVILQFK